MSRTFTSSKPCTWVQPRPYSDASLRYAKHGPIQPLEYPSFFQRLFGRNK
jgi:hypothetical protein